MEQSSAEKALGNPLILQKILKSVGTSDLLNNCRLVAKTNWFDLSTEILSSRKDIQVSFTHLEHGSNEKNEKIEESSISQDHWKKPGFFTAATGNQLSLRSITEYIQNSTTFPFRCFRFAEGFIENDEDFAHFIKVYGQHIVGLELDLLTQKAYNYVVGTFGKILMQLPNLESLRIGKVSLGWCTKDRLFSKKIRQDFKMPKLTSVQIGHDVESDLNFLNDLKAAAPNLELFQTYSCLRLLSAKDAEKLFGSKNLDGTYQHLNFEVHDSNISLFHETARAKLKFRRITVNIKSIKEMSGPIQAQIWPRVTFVLTKILNSSRNTLQELKNIDQLELLPHFEIPPFTEVNSLEIKIVNEFLTDQENEQNYEELGCINNLNFPVTFPALNSVQLSGPSGNSVAMPNNVPTFDPAKLKLNWKPTTTVTILKIEPECSRFVSPGLIELLGKIFPSVERLEIDYLPKFPELTLSIWDHFPKLKILSVKMASWRDRIVPLTLVDENFRIHLDPHSPIMEMDRKFCITLFISTAAGLGLLTCEEDRRLMSDWVRQLKVESEKILPSDCFPIKNVDLPVLVLPSVTSLQLVVASKDSSEKLDLKQHSEKHPTVYNVDLKTTWTPTINKASLTVFSTSFDFPPTIILQMGQSFSSLQKLELEDIENFLELAPVIWTNFPKLIDFSATMVIGVNCTMDMVQEALGVGVKGDSRTSPAICDLRGLKTVALKFYAENLIAFGPKCGDQIKQDLEKVLSNCSVAITVTEHFLIALTNLNLLITNAL